LFELLGIIEIVKSEILQIQKGVIEEAILVTTKKVIKPKAEGKNECPD
jgi:hypothetical protein